MLASALILASALSVLQCPPIVIGTPDNFVFDITSPTGAIGTGTDAVFAGFGHLTVNGHIYTAMECFTLVDNPGGQTVHTPPMITSNGLVIKRSIYVPLRPGANYARYFDRIDNPTAEAVTAVVEIRGALGQPDSASAIVRQRPGWCIFATPNTDKPLIGWVYTRGLPISPAPAAADAYSLTYVVTLKPNSSTAVVNFIVQARPRPAEPTGGLQIAEDDPLDELSQQLDKLQKSPDYSNLSSEEQRIINNFFIDSDVNMDGRVNIIDLIIIRNDLNKTPDSASTPRSDVNHDLRINIIDLIITRNDLGWPY